MEYRNSTEGVDWQLVAALFAEDGWGNRDPAQIAAVFQQSRYVVFLHDDGMLVGFGRSMDDGHFYAMALDVVVASSHRHCRLDRDIVRHLRTELAGYRFIPLIAAPGKEGLHAKLEYLHECARNWPITRPLMQSYAGPPLDGIAMAFSFDDCIPKGKTDFGAVLNAMAVGFPTLNPVIPHLLKWLQDVNWPISSSIAELLVRADVELAPHIQDIFRTEDDYWKACLFSSGLIAATRPEVRALLRADIERLAYLPSAGETYEGAAEQAQDFLGVGAAPA